MAHQWLAPNFRDLFKTYPLPAVSSQILRTGPMGGSARGQEVGNRPSHDAPQHPAPDALARPSRTRWRPAAKKRASEVAEPADKPGSVVGNHSSRRRVAAALEQPTRTRRGPRHGVPIWPCSRWGLPCRPVARLAVRSYRTISPLPDPRGAIGGIFLLHFPSARAAQALPGTVPCGARTFLGMLAHDATVWPTPRCEFYAIAPTRD